MVAIASLELSQVHWQRSKLPYLNLVCHLYFYHAAKLLIECTYLWLLWKIFNQVDFSVAGSWIVLDHQ